MSARLPALAGLVLAAASAACAQAPGSTTASATVLVRVGEPAGIGHAGAFSAGPDHPGSGVLEAEIDGGGPVPADTRATGTHGDRKDGGAGPGPDGAGSRAGGPDNPPGSGRLVNLRPVTFKVEGRRDAAFAVILPADETCVLTAPGAALPVRGFRFSQGGGGAADPFGQTFNDQGRQQFQIGGVLRVLDGLPRLRFTGQFAVTIAYN